MKPYGGRKHVIKWPPRYSRCRVCGKNFEFQLNNDRKNNKMYKVLSVERMEYGERSREDERGD